jgi:hypothetical protein
MGRLGGKGRGKKAETAMWRRKPVRWKKPEAKRNLKPRRNKRRKSKGGVKPHD